MGVFVTYYVILLCHIRCKAEFFHVFLLTDPPGAAPERRGSSERFGSSAGRGAGEGAALVIIDDRQPARASVDMWALQAWVGPPHQHRTTPWGATNISIVISRL